MGRAIAAASTLGALTLGLALCAASPAAQPGKTRPVRPRLTALEEIRLQDGTNTLPNFSGDGRTGQVTVGWRDNGNAHGFRIYLVLLQASRVGSDWNVVGATEDDGRLREVITDQPHVGEDVVRAVRFARGRLDGRRATLLITATRNIDPKEGLPAPAPTLIEVFALRSSGGEIGLTHDYFAPVGAFTTTARYCNANLALNRELGLPLDQEPGTASDC